MTRIIGRPNLLAALLLAGVLPHPATAYPVRPQPREPYDPQRQDTLEAARIAKAHARKARRATRRLRQAGGR